MPILAKGTQFFMMDPSDDSVVKYHKPQSIPELSAPRTEIDVTSIEDDGPQYLPGPVAPGETAINTNFDPGEASHMLALSLYKDDDAPIVQWAIGWPGSTTAPTVVGSVFDRTATTRAFTYFTGYVKDLPHAFQVGQFVTGNLLIKRSGAPEFVAVAVV